MSAAHQEQLESYLKIAIPRVESAIDSLLKAQSYDPNIETLKIILESMKEQVRNENPRSTAR